MASADQIDALLPQTQCTRCGYQGCRPYAQAVADGAAPINQCPPGGAPTIAALARLTGLPVQPLNPDNGTEGAQLVAQIDEQVCIGCAKCLPPCPVDAILGAQKQMHTVLLALCTGCELCIAPCPVDCIRMVPRPPEAGPAPMPAENRLRFAVHTTRAADRTERRAALLRQRKAPTAPPA